MESQAWSAAFRGITATGVLLAGIVACVWLGGGRGPEGWLSAEPLRLIMLGLIVFMGLVLVRFSRHYMAGEARYRHYLRWLLLTLAAVTVVVLSDHLLLLLA
ncbi:MAG: NADH-quinone oxidoreductase subunit L, partial [Anaerolineae bacterium]|nr:NADH-quinone oxidoreductase subunit L [Anaerolineae bacterium]